MEFKDLLALAKIASRVDHASPTAYSFNDESFSAEEVDSALRKELNALAGNYNEFRKNKEVIFQLMEQVIDDVLPQKVIQEYGQFAEVKQFAQGDKPIFHVRISETSRMRAKQFITRVGLAGVYEVFKLDGREVEVGTEAYGGAAQIGIEEFLDGRISFSDILDVVMEGLDEAVYREIARALKASITSLPAANKATASNFDEALMDRLVAVADAYGKSSIFCTYEFAATVIPSQNWISNEMKNTKWNVGYLGNYKGHSVIVLPQSYEDATNATKVIDPSYGWIIPAGANKPVKIAFEGQTVAQDFVNRDFSREVQTYKKFGVATLITNNICVFENTALKLETA